MKIRSTLRDVTVALAAVCVTSALLVSYIAPKADATHEPANKAAAAASDLDKVPAQEGETVILEDTLRVSSPEDAIISVTAECSILTSLTTGGTYGNSSEAFGSIRLWLEIDGIRVPVSTDDTAQDDDDVVQDAEDSDIGEITFCNRTYHRDVADAESPQDGTDVEDDYIRTRTANGFNWLALNLGTTYDVGNDNLINVKLLADFDATELGEATAQAFVGSRTMIIEPTKVSNHEVPAPISESAPSPAPEEGKKP